MTPDKANLLALADDQRSNPPMRRKTAQCAFVFAYLYGTMRQYPDGKWAGGCDGCTTYDDGEAFANEFGERFPGRIADPKGARASKRLRRLLAEMYADGWLDRFRLSDHDQYFPANEPNWQFVYSVAPEYANKLKSGDWTPEYMARRYEGDGDPWLALTSAQDDAQLLADANSHYSAAQIEEMETAAALRAQAASQ
jgi:hypothetical protein